MGEGEEFRAITILKRRVIVQGRQKGVQLQQGCAKNRGVCIKAIQSGKMFGFNITPEAIISCWKLDKNTFISSYLYNMHKKRSVKHPPYYSYICIL